ncbi:MAG: cupin domain-containing protein [Cyanobacteria bacterium J069]|nr:MAG: cupin domain-containing protein [Cyanobacteria bacterium J069]
MYIDPAQVPAKTGTVYPEPFKSLVRGRVKRRLGDAAGLKNFGVNLVTLEPGARSALRHWHQRQDEFVYVLSGEVVLITDAGEQVLTAGMAAGFPAGEANGHHLINRSTGLAMFLEVGDRTPDDQITYPDDDLEAVAGAAGWVFCHKNGLPYSAPE